MCELNSALEALREKIEECSCARFKKVAQGELRSIMKNYEVVEAKFQRCEDLVRYRQVNMESVEYQLRKIENDLLEELNNHQEMSFFPDAPIKDSGDHENVDKYLEWLLDYWTFLSSLNKRLPEKISKYWYVLVEQRKELRQVSSFGNMMYNKEGFWTSSFEIRESVERLNAKLDSIEITKL